MKRLSAAQHSSQRLNRDSHNIIQRLLCGQRDTRGLSVEAQGPRPRAPGAEAVLHHLVPDSARGAELRDLFKEVVVRVEEETEPWSKLIHRNSPVDRVLNEFDPVAKRESKLLQRGRACFANVVAGN